MQSKKICIPIFYPGRKIEHNGKIYTVDHVRIVKHTLLIKFKEITEETDAEQIYCEPTVFVL